MGLGGEPAANPFTGTPPCPWGTASLLAATMGPFDCGRSRRAKASRLQNSTADREQLMPHEIDRAVDELIVDQTNLLKSLWIC